MNIKRLYVSNLFGYLTHEIFFENKINVFVGINGSGKTSLMNMIIWLINGDIDDLRSVKFESIELELEHCNQKVFIKCLQDKDKVIYHLTVDGKDMHPLSASLEICDSPRGREKAELRPEKDEEETYRFIKKLPGPILIGIDRNPKSDESNISAGLYTIKSRSTNSNPILAVQEIIKLENNRYRTALLNLNKKLRDQIIESAFIIRDKCYPESSMDELSIKFKDSEKRVLKYIDLYANSIDKNIVSKYFEKISSQMNITISNAPIDSLDFSELCRMYFDVENLIKIFENYEEKSKAAFEKLHNFINAINGFLIDSNKKIAISERSSDLVFSVVSKDGKAIKFNTNIEFLSSGERQLIILFAYIAFESRNGIVMIDEPELSLHPKWQECFIDSIKLLLPDNAQIILATHSPALIGRNRNVCKIIDLSR